MSEAVNTKVRMISPNGQVSEISISEADFIIQNSFCRPGNVKVKNTGDSWSITDQYGSTLLTPLEIKQ